MRATVQKRDAAAASVGPAQLDCGRQ